MQLLPSLVALAIAVLTGGDGSEDGGFAEGLPIVVDKIWPAHELRCDEGLDEVAIEG